MVERADHHEVDKFETELVDNEIFDRYLLPKKLSDRSDGGHKTRPVVEKTM